MKNVTPWIKLKPKAPIRQPGSRWFNAVTEVLTTLSIRIGGPGEGFKIERPNSDGRNWKIVLPFQNEEIMESLNIGAGKSGIPCKITGEPNNGIYPVDLHANGKNELKTGTGELELLSVHIGEELESGDWVVGHKTTVKVTDISEPNGS